MVDKTLRTVESVYLQKLNSVYTENKIEHGTLTLRKINDLFFQDVLKLFAAYLPSTAKEKRRRNSTTKIVFRAMPACGRMGSARANLSRLQKGNFPEGGTSWTKIAKPRGITEHKNGYR